MPESNSPIYAWRKAQDPVVTQADFGHLVSPQVSAATVSRWEDDAPPIDRVREIARIIDVPVYDLVPGAWETGDWICVAFRNNKGKVEHAK